MEQLFKHLKILLFVDKLRAQNSNDTSFLHLTESLS